MTAFVINYWQLTSIQEVFESLVAFKASAKLTYVIITLTDLCSYISRKAAPVEPASNIQTET